jgi:hypothetical protein
MRPIIALPLLIDAHAVENLEGFVLLLGLLPSQCYIPTRVKTDFGSEVGGAEGV